MLLRVQRYPSHMQSDKLIHTNSAAVIEKLQRRTPEGEEIIRSHSNSLTF